jgi:hypothetical protein
MIWWLIFGVINVLICLADIYRQGFCKAVDLLSTIVMFIAGPFGTAMVLLHYNSERVNSVMERIIWRKEIKDYNTFLEDAKKRRN